ncbi:hypothetical protein DIJ64_02375 [Mycobacterium leprae]|uniref:Uncharacterized protein n=1 Tax=Mycobacterium leprae TaxID=1769 RepID=A0AAD0KU17_MYCLR|nr:hypothetical protein DIJ64_02375 [Mycobacterium leprae]
MGVVLVRIDIAPSNKAARSASLNGEAAVPALVGYGVGADIDIRRRSSRPHPCLSSTSYLSVGFASL